MSVCETKDYAGWADVFDCTEPNSWAYTGILLCLGLSIIGAGL